MPKSLKIFIGAYDKNMSCRCHPEYDTRHVIISAMTKSQAIGFALEAHPDTDPVDWNIVEANTTQLAVYDDDGDLIKSFERLEMEADR
jgi:hypothetical protein